MSLVPDAAAAAAPAEHAAEDTVAGGKAAAAADALTARECAHGHPLAADCKASGRDQVDDGAVADLEVPELKAAHCGAQHRGRRKGSAADRPATTTRRVASELLDMMPSLGGARSRTSGADVQWQLGELLKRLSVHEPQQKEHRFWSTQPQAWHIGVRVLSNKKLVAFIGAIPIELVVQGRRIQMVEINFLCVHKKLRTKRLAPVLIKEVTRRVKLEGIYQAVYTAGVVLPTPIATCRYYHRSLNPRKLLDVNFSRVPQHITVARYLRRFKLPTTTSLPGLRPTEKRDVPAVRALLNRYLAKFPVRPNFVSDEEAEHWLTPRKGVVWSYVVEVSMVAKWFFLCPDKFG
ncbi:MAG: Myristoyl-CoA:protein N-myristoyltransferase, N-terminal domain-containing protein [Olpidium bornovanus]|uniref:Glycylpeptide N-tetradecanoyltransferase n=1 Tax=Olpidium bornovanus TaxID=278681 RepID=A0A8H8DH94_9FUNG|nr:MAG: Myristoyl-CoA:protein N-myristoyltransferase, N-terminal domain-containing protein [Olpidium bornovanus]